MAVPRYSTKINGKNITGGLTRMRVLGLGVLLPGYILVDVDQKI